jgi:hypothetical protein
LSTQHLGNRHLALDGKGAGASRIHGGQPKVFRGNTTSPSFGLHPSSPVFDGARAR